MTPDDRDRTPSPRADDLLDRLDAGDLRSEERQALEHRLRSDPAFLDAYLRRSVLETDLEAVLSADKDFEVPRAPRPPMRRRRLAFVALAAAVAATGVIVVASRPGVDQRPRQPGRVLSAPGPGQGAPNRPRSPSAVAGAGPTVAVVVEADVVSPDRSDGLAAGRRLSAGPLSLESGRALLVFLGGAHLFLEGPAELVLESPTAASLTRGRAAVRDGGGTRHFRLNVPDASLVDLGTEFAVRTDRTGNSVVRVHEGEIAVSVLDREGSTRFSDTLGTEGVLALSSRGTSPVRPDPGDAFSRVPPVPRAEPPAGDAYARAVRESRPLVYWRFEGVDAEGLIPDEGSAGCRGRIVDGGDAASVALAGGAAEFRRSRAMRRVESERDLPGAHGAEFSVELWAQTAEATWQTLFGLVIPDVASEQRSVAVLEFAHETPFLHGPMALRALSRNSPGKAGGTNLFGEDRWVPGWWHHVVFTGGRDGLRLYVDGRPARSRRSSPADDPAPYRIVLGQLHEGAEGDPGRPFVGALDEFAFYGRVLSPEEVAGHYRARR